MVEASYSGDSVRANLALADGTYMTANYALESGALANIYEASLGLKLSDRHNVWLDVGVMPSHIGFEGAIGTDYATLTRSMAADNSPYFETGAKVTYTSEFGRWTLSGLILNGWQRIEGPDGNSTPSFGHQLTYKPNDRITLNSSSFVGNDKSDEQRRTRYFHNLYGIFQLSDRWHLWVGFDFGAEQSSKGSSSHNTWFTPVAIARFSATSRTSVAARVEYFDDENGVIVSSQSPDGFKMFGYSINVDHRLSSSVLWRTEVKLFDGKGREFLKENGTWVSDGAVAITALAVSF